MVDPENASSAVYFVLLNGLSYIYSYISTGGCVELDGYVFRVSFFVCNMCAKLKLKTGWNQRIICKTFFGAGECMCVRERARMWANSDATFTIKGEFNQIVLLYLIFFLLCCQKVRSVFVAMFRLKLMLS